MGVLYCWRGRPGRLDRRCGGYRPVIGGMSHAMWSSLPKGNVPAGCVRGYTLVFHSPGPTAPASAVGYAMHAFGFISSHRYCHSKFLAC